MWCLQVVWEDFFDLHLAEEPVEFLERPCGNLTCLWIFIESIVMKLLCFFHMFSLMNRMSQHQSTKRRVKAMFAPHQPRCAPDLWFLNRGGSFASPEVFSWR